MPLKEKMTYPQISSCLYNTDVVVYKYKGRHYKYNKQTKVKEYKCKKCEHEWYSQLKDDNGEPRPPKVCPRCKSYDYNK